MWSVQLDKVNVGGFLSMSLARHALVDSGTSLLVGPKAEIAVIATMIGAVYAKGRYMVDCDATVPALSFTLGGKDYILEKDDLIFFEADGVCVLGLDTTSEPKWTLGDIFMRKYYVQFDWGKKRV